ncbi:MAG TPA: Ig-like domain repeat protein, partial [Acidimicrobiales bacterium]|nr:Ig-like domain repeat protein [Acidimicrobiales bacterium]
TPQAAASGGGVSSYIPTPSWQVGTGVPGTQGRYTPDIAFTSSAHDGYFGCLAASGGSHPGDCVVRNGSFYFEYFFGTSCAAPDMAGITALLDQKMNPAGLGSINPRLYQLAADPANAVFHDVTVATSGVSGCVVTTPSMCNNSTPSPTGLTGGLAGYLVDAGYDEVTGWGSIDVGNLLTYWVPGAATTTSVTSNENPANFGDSVTFTATVTTTGTNAPTGTVGFNDGSASLGSSTLTTVNGSQVATLTTSALAPGTHSITAVYNGDANNAPSTSSVLMQTINAPTFNWTINGPTSGTVLSGQSTTYNFTATPTSAGTFVANVTFSCSGLPDATVSCSFNPTQISVGAGQTSVTLTITTTGPNSSGAGPRRAGDKRSAWPPLALPLVGIVMVGFAGRRVSKRSAIGGLGASLALLAILVACGGGGGSGPPPIEVSVSSGTPPSVFPNDTADNWPPQTAQFTATVTNTTNTAVTWAVTTPNGGTIDKNSGLYTAPTVAAGLPTKVTITATSVADPSASGSGQETLKAATIPGTYSNIMVTATEATTVNSVPVTLVVQ